MSWKALRALYHGSAEPIPRKLPVAVGFGPGVPDAVNPFESGHGQGHQPDECSAEDVKPNGLKTYIIALLELDKMM